MSSNPKIEDGKVVFIHYTLTDASGEVIDSSREREPMAYLQGHDNIVPGLERQLVGLEVGDQILAVVQPEEGYGVREDLEPLPVPRDQFPADLEILPGMQFYGQGPDEQQFPLWVVDVSEAHIFMDPQHPLAGVTLHFDVEVVALRDALPEELSHGHPHQPGGEHH